MAETCQPRKLLDWIDDIADRFEAAWRASPRPPIADYLAGETGAARVALLVELVKIDVQYRRQAGEAPALEDYLRAFPELHGRQDSVTVDLPGPDLFAGTKELRCPQCGNPFGAVNGAAHQLTCPSCGSTVRVAAGPCGPAAMADLPRPLGKFQLLTFLGQGAFGAVYKARDTELNRVVAVKVPRAGSFASAEEEQRFLREARSAAQLTHPGIVQVHEIAHTEKLPYIVRDYVDGRTLAQMLAERRPAYRESAELTAQIADALDYAHRHKVVHRDVNPRNILIDAAGRPHVTDFGLARREEVSLAMTLDGQVLGTPGYMAPEQAAGEQSRVDGRSDVYSLGVVLYEMLTGERPFRGSIHMLLHQVIHDEPRPPRRLNDRIPRDLETICLKAMAKSPAQRYATAGELAADLRRFLKGEPIRARPVSPIERFGRWCRRNPVVALLAGSVAAALLLGMAGVSYFAVRTEAEKERVRRNLYVAQMNLAGNAWDTADVERVVELLEEQRPQDGQADLRHFEWHYLRHACHGELLELRGFDEFIADIAFSSDGESLTTAGVSRLWVFDAATGREKTSRIIDNSDDRPKAAALSPDGQRLAAWGLGRPIRVWNQVTGQEIVSLGGPVAYAEGLVFSRDGQRLASTGWNGNPRGGKPVTAELNVWDLATGRARFSIHKDSWHFQSLTFSPDCNRLVAIGGSWDHVKYEFRAEEIVMWDLANGEAAWTLKIPAGFRRTTFSPDGTRLAVAQERTIVVRNSASGSMQLTLSGHTANVVSVAFSPDGRRLASCGKDHTVRLWDAETGQPLFVIRGHAREVHLLTFSPDGRHLASCSYDKTVKIWDTTTGPDCRILRGHRAGVMSVAFSPDGQSLASASDDRTVRIWDTASGRPLHVLEGHEHDVNSIIFSPDGRLLASGGNDKTVRLWDAATGKPLRVTPAHRDNILSVAFRPDGQRLASSSRDKSVKIWDVASGQAVLTLKGHEGPVQRVVFSPDGKRLATASDDETVKLWDADSGRVLLSLEGHTHWVYAVAFSPDGRQLASADDHGNVLVWDVVSGQERLRLHGHRGKSFVYDVAFSPDGKRLATCGGDRTVKLWDQTTGMATLTLKGHADEIYSVAFSPDGRMLASASKDGTVRIWDATPLP